MKRFVEMSIPSVVFVVNAVEFRELLVFLNLASFKKLVLLFLLFNAYCFSISQISGLKFKDRFSYLWVFSPYVFVPFFFKLSIFLNFPSSLSPFIAFILGEIISYGIFKEVFLTLEISRLVLLITLVSGMVAWIA